MRKLSVLISCVAVGAMGLSALAQDKKPDQPPAGDRQPRGNRPGGPGGGGMMRGQLPPERAKAAWEAEATGVAKHAGLNEAQTKSLVAAYTAARESHAESMQKLMKEVRDAAEGNERPDPQAMQEKMQGLNKAEKEKFQKAVGATLSADQAAKVLASLGSFNGQWDRWVDALGEFKLDPAKNQQAMDALETFVLASEKARAGDRETMRESMQAARADAREQPADELAVRAEAVFVEETDALQHAAPSRVGQGVKDLVDSCGLHDVPLHPVDGSPTSRERVIPSDTSVNT